MDYKTAPAEKSTVKVTITYSKDEWDEAIGKAYTRTRGKYSVPGFRKGKAPRPVLENFYGKGVFFDEAFNILFSATYPDIIAKEKDNFTAVGDPSLSVDEISDENGVTLTATVPVKPDVEIGSYKGLKIRSYEYNVTDEEVDKEANRILLSKAEDVAVSDRPCKNGDIVKIDFSGSVDGVKFPGGTAEDYDLELGSGAFIPGFEEQVEGMSVGEEKNITVKFPDDYQADDLKGKEAVFEIKLKGITEKKYPELTDEFVKANGGCETVEEYKKKCRERLESRAATRSVNETENSILKAICATAKAEIPDAMVEQEIDKMVQDFSYRLMYQGVKLEDYLKYMGLTMEQFRSQFTGNATERVMSTLVIDKIVRTENIKAEPEEVEAKIAEQAASVGKTAEEYKKNLDPRQREYIESDIVVSKLFDFLKSNNEMYTE
ncbi:MAG TPA: trigger factor [Candidatus Coproplasma stercoripullorum]|uniref:Trigger factor n=1 Tax=Candidatus Coproplasma stercoripullorum TaxID=2840751 RepID=A0A9D1DD34_9FIRM|nr:trigger factor [Candidatus Coproplasma stercoripullorum]